MNRREEHGFTVIELSVGMAVAGLFMLVVYATLFSGMRQQRDLDERVQIQSETRVALDQLVRDLRQAHSGDPEASPIEAIAGDSITFLTPNRENPYRLRRIVYRVNGRTLERSITTSVNSGTPPWTWPTQEPFTDITTGVRDANVFAYHDASGATTTDPAAVSTIALTFDMDPTPTRSPAPFTYQTTVNVRATR